MIDKDKIQIACSRIGVASDEIIASLERMEAEQQNRIQVVCTADFFDKLINHPKMQKAKRRQITKVQGAQWKRERRGFRP